MVLCTLPLAGIAPGQEEESGAVELPPAPEGLFCLALILQVLVELQHSGIKAVSTIRHCLH